MYGCTTCNCATVGVFTLYNTSRAQYCFFHLEVIDAFSIHNNNKDERHAALLMDITVASETLEGMFNQDYPANMQSTRILLHHRL